MKIGNRFIITFGFILIFFCAIAIWIGVFIQRFHTNEIVQKDAIKIADSVMNGLNFLMQNGMMEKSESLLEQNRQLDGVQEMRVFRSILVNEKFGKEKGFKRANDSIEEGVLLSGKIYSQRIKSSTGESMRVIIPYIASKNHKGIDCVACHQVPEGTVIGGLNMVVSLEKENEVTKNTALAFTALTLLGVVILAVIFMVLSKKFLNEPLHNFAEVLAKIADGKLNVQSIDSKFLQGEIKELNRSIQNTVKSFNLAMHELQNASDECFKLNSGLRDTAEVILDGSKNQVKSVNSVFGDIGELTYVTETIVSEVDQQADLSIKASDQFEEVSKALQEILKGFSEIQALQNQAKDLIEKGNKPLKDTIDGMQKIKASTSSISEVLVAIDEIADRTQLLSLNASIEAARAGEAGRGFAVVASEVGKLALNSAEYADKIKNQIKENMKNVETGSQFVIDVSQSMKEIFLRVENSTEMTNKIAKEFENFSDINAKAESQIKELKQIAFMVKGDAESQLDSNRRIENSMGEIKSQTEKFADVSSVLGEKSKFLAEEVEKFNQIIKKFEIN